VNRLLLASVCVLWLTGLAQAQELFGRAEETVPEEVEQMYRKGLKYLERELLGGASARDGYGNQPAVIGLAVTAILAHGDDPNTGPYRAAVKRGLDQILSGANRANGYLGASMYNHGFATLALAEAYGAVDDPRLGPALQRAVDLILTSQANNPLGGWRYSPESQDADTTVSGAQLVALLAARNAGIAVPDEAIEKALRFFIRCSATEGGFGYTSAAGPNNPRSAIGVLVFALAKQKDARAYQGALRFLSRDPFRDDGYPFYFHYYAAQALFQADPEAWKSWNARMIKVLAATQNTDGSWDGNHGRLFSTAAALLTLALNYRFLPIYER
jgi:hypothetical protein